MKSVEKLKSFAEKQNGILQQFYAVSKQFLVYFFFLKKKNINLHLLFKNFRVKNKNLRC
jgi:hypothetical protein